MVDDGYGTPKDCSDYRGSNMALKTFELEAGMTVGKIVKMEMGIKFTGVWIQEKLGNDKLEHYILVTNGVAKSLRTGDDVNVRLEIYEKETTSS